MSITPALKALMAEKAKAEQETQQLAVTPDWRAEHMIRLIDDAAHKLDAKWDGKGWMPSELLKLRYLIASTRAGKRTAEWRGEKIVMQALAPEQPR